MASTGRGLSKYGSEQNRRSRELNLLMPIVPTKMQKMRPKEREISNSKINRAKMQPSPALG